ncbi:MAG: sulfatase-like hydrolase/transferase [Rhodobacteraceae bacterium]|nr:sulfatase-like hydrolase/transferase [Paracoccaceae bacterium]
MPSRPSFILFITDQQRFDYLGCNGHPSLRTPHIDEMASEGVNYDRFYVASPVCMPNRASLLTCRMPSSHGVRSLGIPLAHENVTFVELLRAAGYDTALIGKSHLQNVTDWPVQFDPVEYRGDFTAPPPDLASAIRSDLDSEAYRYEQNLFWSQENPEVPTPYYGFDHFDAVLRHGANCGGDYELWLRQHAPEMLDLRGNNPESQLPHDYICPQAIRTRLPERYYSTSYIAGQASAWIRSRRGNPKPFFLMVSFPDPHHPFTPPGKYWDMYSPGEMPIPKAYEVDDWEPPEYIRIAERARQHDRSLGRKTGYTVAVSRQEAVEARALTCGMISFIDDAVGCVRTAACEAGIAESTVQIFTSDHGDHLGDHRLLFKGAEQYDTLTHVPFIWADPKGHRGIRCRDLAQTHDIGMTILEHAGIEGAVGMQGRIMSVAGGDGRRAAYIQYETQRPQEAFGAWPRAHTVIENDWRLTVYLGRCGNELFDLSNDPGEMVNLWDSKAQREVKYRLMERLVELGIAVHDRVPLPTAQG